MNAKETAMEIYKKHLALASTDGRGFRKTVMDELMSTIGCTIAAAATHYNNCKKLVPVEGLGRPAVAPGSRKQAKGPEGEDLQDDNECYSVLELLPVEGGLEVGRCQSFLMQGDASEKFDDKVVAWPKTRWVMIKGLGPNAGAPFKLDDGEEEIKRYEPVDNAVA